MVENIQVNIFIILTQGWDSEDREAFQNLGEKNPEFLKEKTHSFEYMKM